MQSARQVKQQSAKPQPAKPAKQQSVKKAPQSARLPVASQTKALLNKAPEDAIVAYKSPSQLFKVPGATSNMSATKKTDLLQKVVKSNSSVSKPSPNVFVASKNGHIFAINPKVGSQDVRKQQPVTSRNYSSYSPRPNTVQNRDQNSWSHRSWYGNYSSYYGYPSYSQRYTAQEWRDWFSMNSWNSWNSWRASSQVTSSKKPKAISKSVVSKTVQGKAVATQLKFNKNAKSSPVTKVSAQKKTQLSANKTAKANVKPVKKEPEFFAVSPFSSDWNRMVAQAEKKARKDQFISYSPFDSRFPSYFSKIGRVPHRPDFVAVSPFSSEWAKIIAECDKNVDSFVTYSPFDSRFPSHLSDPKSVSSKPALTKGIYSALATKTQYAVQSPSLPLPTAAAAMQVPGFPSFSPYHSMTQRAVSPVNQPAAKPMTVLQKGLPATGGSPKKF